MEQEHEDPQQTKVYRQREMRTGNKKGERSVWERIGLMKQKWKLNRTREEGEDKSRQGASGD